MLSINDKIKGTHYGCKTISLKVDDIDEGKRLVKAYASTFDVVDADRDSIKKGAFAKSIQEHGVESSSNRKIAHLRNHNWDSQIGKLVELKEDDRGLYFVSKLGTSSKGEDALRDYADGILMEHSIGFNYVQDKIKQVDDKEGGHFEIFEVKLWEISAVTFGANYLTPVLEVQKGTGSTLVEHLNERIQKFTDVIRNGKGTDERFLTLELELKQIQQLLKSLELNEPPKGTPTPEPGKEDEEIKRQLFLKLLKQ